MGSSHEKKHKHKHKHKKHRHKHSHHHHKHHKSSKDKKKRSPQKSPQKSPTGSELEDALIHQALSVPNEANLIDIPPSSDEDTDAATGQSATEHKVITPNKEIASGNRKELQANKDTLQANKNTLQALQTNKNTLQDNKDTSQANKGNLQDSLQTNRDTLQASKDTLQASKDTLQANKDSLQALQASNKGSFIPVVISKEVWPQLKTDIVATRGENKGTSNNSSVNDSSDIAPVSIPVISKGDSPVNNTEDSTTTNVLNDSITEDKTSDISPLKTKKEKKKSRKRSRSTSRSRRRSRSDSRSRKRSDVRSRRQKRSRSGSRSRHRSRSGSRSRRRSRSGSRSRRRSRSGERSRRRSRSGERSRRRSRSGERSRRRSRSGERSRRRSRSEERSRRRSRSGERSRRRSRSEERSRRRSRSGERSRRRSRSGERSRRRSGSGERSRRRSKSGSRSRRSRRSRSRSSSREKNKEEINPFVTNLPIPVIKTKADIIAEFTDFCRDLRNENISKRTTEHNHPFQLAEQQKTTQLAATIPSMIISPTQMVVDINSGIDTRPIEMKFPVSSGLQHQKEGLLDVTNNEQITTSTLTGTSSMSVSDIISERTLIQQRLLINPADTESASLLQQLESKLSQWCQVQSVPGRYTGCKEVTPMDKSVHKEGLQAWAKKKMFHGLKPVKAGFGMMLMMKMGWKQGEPLGKSRQGYVEPIPVDVKTDRQGLSTDEDKQAGVIPLANAIPAGQNTPLCLQGKHPVSALQELCSKKQWDPPSYDIVSETGPIHMKTYMYKVRVNQESYQPSCGANNKKLAKAQAALSCLKALGLVPN